MMKESKLKGISRSANSSFILLANPCQKVPTKASSFLASLKLQGILFPCYRQGPWHRNNWQMWNHLYI
ncbi:hypothetical protein GDO81_011991 [Engystomops pustulosus]|uniref:Uncharacterized protein n=1 Tax=Engystomops pustulosus TaxID=76066 RepID=A0AAV7BIV2_ENGPU|nr:hypothetical protein GDO81_011991 [Engystomops pustulosus]